MPTLKTRIEALEKRAPKLHGQALLNSLWTGFWRDNPELAERVRNRQRESKNAKS
jgi:hypothetical protein